MLPLICLQDLFGGVLGNTELPVIGLKVSLLRLYRISLVLDVDGLLC